MALKGNEDLTTGRIHARRPYRVADRKQKKYRRWCLARTFKQHWNIHSTCMQTT
jgi:hypothetical protein